MDKPCQVFGPTILTISDSLPRYEVIISTTRDTTNRQIKYIENLEFWVTRVTDI